MTSWRDKPGLLRFVPQVSNWLECGVRQKKNSNYVTRLKKYYPQYDVQRSTLSEYPTMHGRIPRPKTETLVRWSINQNLTDRGPPACHLEKNCHLQALTPLTKLVFRRGLGTAACELEVSDARDPA